MASTGMNEDEMNNELDELSFQVVILSQNLLETKIMLEKVMKEGFINLAQARYSSGRSISSLQLPNEDWEPFEANAKVMKSECVRQEINVKFNYLSLELGPTPKKSGKVENLDSTLNNRKKQDKEVKNEKKKVDPLKWFGVLVPTSLKQSQKHFDKAIALSIEATNIQNEIGGILARRLFLQRHLRKLESNAKNGTQVVN